ncbi:MAG: hypothetical protein CL860_04655 [Cyanobium sp. MED195]|uniref:hypothetical protein n=1 Tax=Synechococcus sp. (strain CC9311) TaxID=64471 RepID=UPI0000DDB3E5|nr:hypothetical protein [Synechococcus sp. CC9311]ABI47238.1 hypothetical protein sync_2838 [Synechococcus sp. CC9311]MAK15927.1 hypothetical protein [Cyanobium sp. MED195]
MNHPLVRTHLLPYRLASGEEVPGLVVELENDLNGGVEVRVLTDANVVSAVTLATLQHGESEA